MGAGTLGLLNLIGGVAVLLWGLRMVRTGAMRALGGNLRWCSPAPLLFC
jgi:phosphate:Na+ symporter